LTLAALRCVAPSRTIFASMAAKKRARRKRTGRSGALSCPFCGEADEIYVDPGGGDAQVYTEDCSVCCRPRVVHVEPGEVSGDVHVWLERG
jgi:cysteine-rich CPXCG protein